MRKNKLIELLQQIEGNPEVHFWNGFVEDFMPISENIDSFILVKESKDFIFKNLIFKHMREYNILDENEVADEVRERLKVVADDAFKRREWDFPNEYVPEDEYKTRYGNHRKKICLIQAKPRGKTTWDRMGNIDY